LLLFAALAGTTHAQSLACDSLGAIRAALRTDTAAAGLKPDIVLGWSVSARELRFESQPRVSVSFRGCPGLDSLVITRRENLPKPVQPGVTYNNILISGELRSYLISRCLSAAGTPAGQQDSLRLRSFCGPPSTADSVRNRSGSPRRR
jgi:hypothetical protein